MNALGWTTYSKGRHPSTAERTRTLAATQAHPALASEVTLCTVLP